MVADSDAIPEVDAVAFARYHRASGPMRGSDPPNLFRRNSALHNHHDPRLWQTDSGAYTDVVLAAAAVAKCTSNGFDIDDLLKRAAAIPRPALQRVNEPGYTEPMLLCNKCGAWWRESQPEAHKAGC